MGHVIEQCEEYLLGTLPREAREEVIGHLGQCCSCREAFSATEDALQLIAFDAPRRVPPAALEARLMARVSAMQRSADIGRLVSHADLRVRPLRPLQNAPLQPEGVILARMDAPHALVAAGHLPFSAQKPYRVWMLTEDGDRIEVGSFFVNRHGVGQTFVVAPDNIGSYPSMGISFDRGKLMLRTE